MLFFNELSQLLAIVSQLTALIFLPSQNNSGATAYTIAPELLTLSAIARAKIPLFKDVLSPRRFFLLLSGYSLYINVFHQCHWLTNR